LTVICRACILRHNALYQNSKRAIKPVLVSNCRNAAIHWFSKARVSAGGMLNAIEISATGKEMYLKGDYNGDKFKGSLQWKNQSE